MTKIKTENFELTPFLPTPKIINDMFDLVNAERDRLEPYFYWMRMKIMGKKLTESKLGAALFATYYTISSKLKKHKTWVAYKDGKFAGMIGFEDLSKSDASIWEFCTKDMEGKGFTTQIFKLIEDYLFNTKNLQEIFVAIEPDNKRSLTLAKKCGYEFDEPALRRGHIVYNFRKQKEK
jgi:RimJ/RimL family protein N-acetyltransferase